MDSKSFCIELLTAESEDEAIAVLKNHNYWDNDECWKNFGNNENNFSTVGNQQSKPEAALVEKIINSVDAILIS
ncbi:MAG TPA: hypothetical protein PK523_07465, partial [Elusimicrobiales bacterium]|nr:hypothetical protein [Elusimicrobiales bacterium]